MKTYKTKNGKSYTKKQICEAIEYWENKLNEMLNEGKEEDSQQAIFLLRNLVLDIENKEDLLKSDNYKNAQKLLTKLHLI